MCHFCLHALASQRPGRWEKQKIATKTIMSGISAPRGVLHARRRHQRMAANSKVWLLYDGQAQLALQANTIVPPDGP
jgi:hypothetical protein